MIRIISKPFAVAVIALLACIVANAQSVPQFKDGKVTGPGFVVMVPNDLPVEVAATPETLNGFYIGLPPRSAPAGTATLRQTAAHPASYRYIAFEAKWDTGDMPSLGAVVDSITSNLIDSIPANLVNAGDVSLEGNFPARLGTLPARRVVLKYKNTERKPAVRQIVVAYNARKDASAIVYFFVLNTTEENFLEDLSLFSKVLAGFKLADQ